jgi:hypothetical protein
MFPIEQEEHAAIGCNQSAARVVGGGDNFGFWAIQ